MDKIILSLLFIAFNYNLYAQCCSQGTPMAGDANVGVLEKRGIRVGSFYKYSFSENKNRMTNHAPQVNANFNFIGFSLAYGITHKMTAELELGYFLNKTQNFEIGNPDQPTKTALRGFGLTNGIISVKHILLKKEEKNLEISGALGFKFPFQSKTQVVNNVELPVDNLPSTYAPGIVPKFLIFKKIPNRKMAFVLLQRYDYNFENYKRYQFGASSATTLIVSKKLSFVSDKLTGLLQFRNEYRSMDTKAVTITGAVVREPVTTSGSHLVFITPQFSLQLFKKLNTSFAVDIPVYKKYNVDKLENIYAVTFNCSMDL